MATGRAAVAVCVGGALTSLDLTIVVVALPTVDAELGGGLGAQQWVVTGYTLAFASLILTAGALSDRIGDRPVFATGVALFTAASAACGLAQTVPLLIGARVLQGMGAAAILATSIALLARTYSGSARATAIAAWVTVGTLAANLGPLGGGLLVDALGWRAIFLVNVPIGVLLLVTLPALIPAPTPSDGPRRPLDVGGLALAVVALFALNTALLTGPELGWVTPTVLGAGIIAVLAFLAFGLHQSLRRERALIDLRLFRIPTFSGAVLLSLLSRIASFGALPFFVLWLQGPVGLSATATGLAMLGMSLPVLLLSFVGARLQRLVPARTLIAVGNLAGVAAGLALLFGITPDSGVTAALPGFVLIGVSAGLVFPSLMGLAVGVVPPERAGLASGVANTFFPLGTAVGVAVFGVVLAGAADRAGLVGPARDATLAGTGDPAALVAGLDGIAACMAALSALGVLVAVALVRERDRLPVPH